MSLLIRSTKMLLQMAMDKLATPAVNSGLSLYNIVGFVALLLGITSIVTPDYFGWLVESPFAGTDAVASGINVGIEVFVSVFKPSLRMIASSLDIAVHALQTLLHATPWPVFVVGVTWFGWYLSKTGLALLCGGSVLYMALSGYWIKSMNTLSMVGVAVPLALLIGFGLGVLGAKSRPAGRMLLPILDLMQTIPTFAYLAPLVILFGFGPVPGVLASIIYAAPPMARNVMLGLASVPAELREVALMSGATPVQRFFSIELPYAKQQILIGFNQLVLASLSMVIIAAVIGGFDDIGREVLLATNKGSARFGQALGAGVVIVLLAIVIDRLSRAVAHRRPVNPVLGRTWLRLSIIGFVVAVSVLLGDVATDLTFATAEYFRFAESGVNGWLSNFIIEYGATLDMIKNKVLIYLLLPLRIGLTKAVLPITWGLTFTAFAQHIYLALVIAGAVLLFWCRRQTYAGFLLGVGMIVFSGFTYLPWWAVFGVVAWLSWRMAGFGFAFAATFMMLAITLTGHWQDAMYSVYLCSAAVMICLVIGCPLGVLAAKNNIVSRILAPINDTLQSIPLYIFLIPAVALFQVNEFSALFAIILYAIVPLIRYTEHGLRHVPATLVDAARANGCSALQRLFYVELPVARPSILLGLNQTVLFSLAMLIIAALVGARGLAEQVNIGLRDANTGLGLTAGFSMAFIAIIADRILRGWACQLGGESEE